jgi:hypothetical protein
MIKLYIDDLRQPPDNTWVVTRSYQETVDYIETNGLPATISFDHDLGLEESGYDIAKWIVEQMLDKKLDFPEGFSYHVHSANPVGKQNIECLLDNFAKYHTENKGDSHV